jgi:hypothetical protein
MPRDFCFYNVDPLALGEPNTKRACFGVASITRPVRHDLGSDRNRVRHFGAPMTHRTGACILHVVA